MAVEEMTLEALIPNIQTVITWIDGKLEELGCPMKAQMQIFVAAEEIFVNVAHYAYGPENGDVTVSIEIDGQPRAAAITFTDRGKPYDPLARPDPDVTLGLEERGVGGLGVFMVKKTMDGMAYRREGGKNILTIRKII